MPTLLHLLVYLLAVCRVVRFLTKDELFAGPRNRFVFWAMARDADYDPADQQARMPKLAYMATCPWCVSIWVCAVATPLVLLLGDSWWLFGPALALAGSYAVGFLASHEGK